MAEGHQDPRPQFFAELKRALPTTGSVVAYNVAFEKNVVSYGYAANVESQGWRARIEPRFLDSLEPFRSFHYYHPEQHGSASIKAAPAWSVRVCIGAVVTRWALTGRGYERHARTVRPPAVNSYESTLAMC